MELARDNANGAQRMQTEKMKLRFFFLSQSPFALRCHCNDAINQIVYTSELASVVAACGVIPGFLNLWPIHFMEAILI